VKSGFNKTILILIITGIVAAMLVVVNFMLFQEVTLIFSIINVMAIFIFIFPVIMVRYEEYAKIKQTEEMFPIFLRDFVESIRGGMTVPHAFKRISQNDYKELNTHIAKMTAQMDWGIPVDKVLMKFAKQSKSKLIARIISSVMESHRFGGNLADTFEALSNTSLEVEKLRQERKLYMNSQMMTGYIVFFVFLAVMIGLAKFLVPSLTQANPGELNLGTMQATQVDVNSPPVDVNASYKDIFRNLILIQGFFAGLTVGKMSEGSTVSGLKHSVFMMFSGALVFIIATA